MKKALIGLNPSVLKWARETSGYSIDEVADIVKKDVAEIERWESGISSPSYSILEKLAYQLYKRPMAIFFFASPPEEKPLSKSFRSLPDFEIESLSPDTLFILRQAQVMQLSLYELNDSKNRSERLIFREIQIKLGVDPVSAAKKARNFIGINFKSQLSWKNTDEALKSWRESLHDCGIYVFKRSFKQREISGISLWDNEFPVIFLNNSTTHTRQIFSIFHELAHILLGENGVNKLADSFLLSLTGHYRQIEMFCNSFASEFLLPREYFDTYSHSNFYDDVIVQNLAEKFKVSREVVLRKAVDLDLVDKEHYEQKAKEWTKQAKIKRSAGRGNYYSTQATYLGSRYLSLAFSSYYKGKCSVEQLADYLNVKARAIPGLELYISSGLRT